MPEPLTTMTLAALFFLPHRLPLSRMYLIILPLLRACWLSERTLASDPVPLPGDSVCSLIGALRWRAHKSLEVGGVGRALRLALAHVIGANDRLQVAIELVKLPSSFSFWLILT